MKASFPDKPPSGATDQGAVHQQDDGRVAGGQGPDDQSEQRPTQAERRPLGAVKHAVIEAPFTDALASVRRHLWVTQKQNQPPLGLVGVPSNSRLRAVDLLVEAACYAA